MAEIRVVEDSQHLETARSLMREYGRSIASIAACSLQYQRFDEELAALPGCYAPPPGCILLALDGGEAVGCIALRPLEHLDGPGRHVCEMKRMYVRPASRRGGTGRRLAVRLLSEARRLGYTQMVLDTSPEMTQAIRLYRSLGFVERDAYNEDPDAGTLWFSLDLARP